MKSVRHRRIMSLIRQQPVTSQNQLVKLLRAAGIPATQATVSRDLEEPGAIKVRRNGKVAYSFGEEATAPVATEAIRRILSESVTSIEVSSNLLVIKTPPGHAAVVASALDRGGSEVFAGIAGTVAGDDTVIAVCRQGVLPRKVDKQLRAMVDTLPGVRNANKGDVK